MWQNRKRTLEGNLSESAARIRLFEAGDECHKNWSHVKLREDTTYAVYLVFAQKPQARPRQLFSAQTPLAHSLNCFLTTRAPLRLQHINNVSSNFPSLIKNVYSLWSKAKTFKKIRMLWYEHPCEVCIWATFGLNIFYSFCCNYILLKRYFIQIVLLQGKDCLPQLVLRPKSIFILMTPHIEIFELAIIVTITNATVYLCLCQSYQKALYIFFSSYISQCIAWRQSDFWKAAIQFSKPSMMLSLFERQYSYKHYFKNTILHINIKDEINQNQIFSENSINCAGLFNFLAVEPWVQT